MSKVIDLHQHRAKRCSETTFSTQDNVDDWCVMQQVETLQDALEAVAGGLPEQGMGTRLREAREAAWIAYQTIDEMCARHPEHRHAGPLM